MQVFGADCTMQYQQKIHKTICNKHESSHIITISFTNKVYRLNRFSFPNRFNLIGFYWNELFGSIKNLMIRKLFVFWNVKRFKQLKGKRLYWKIHLFVALNIYIDKNVHFSIQFISLQKFNEQKDLVFLKYSSVFRRLFEFK